MQTVIRMNESTFNTAFTQRRGDLLRQLIDPRKDIDAEAGYPTDPTVDDYKHLYDREGIAKRVVRILPDESWGQAPELVETEDADETEFEKQWKMLQKRPRVNLVSNMHKVDVLSGIGRFGVLLLGTNDGKSLEQEYDGVAENVSRRMMGQKVESAGRSGNRELIYVRAFDESCVTIDTYDDDKTSPRYQLPILYSITMRTADGKKETTVKVHWTRVIHIAEDRESDEVFAVPRQQPVFNRLYDVRKICGGSGEMFWRGGFQGVAIEVMPDDTGAEVQVDKKAMREEMERWGQGLQRTMVLEGAKANNLAPNVADPTAHFEMNIKSICITLEIPYRIFMGSEKAELASSQDKKTWNARVTRRRENYVTPHIIAPVVDRLIDMGIIDAPKSEDGYKVDWPDLDSPSALDRAEVAVKITEALAKYVSNGLQVIMEPSDYLIHVLRFSQDVVEELQISASEFMGDEDEEEEPPDNGRRQQSPPPRQRAAASRR